MKLVLLRMDQTRSRGGGTGRYHSRAAMPPRPPPLSGSAPLGVGGAAPMVRRSVFAPPFPNVSYIRSMPLWLDAMKPRYPGDHMSTNACVHTPGIPYEIIFVSSKLENHGSSA